MLELPEYLMQREQPVDPIFSPDETLFRRVRPDDWDDDDVDLDAIEFPDMSVNRSKFGPPESARWDRGQYVNWGVIGFVVRDIPVEIPFQGAVIYRLRPVHKPHKRNYPHSEVQVFEAKWDSPGQENHIGVEKMPGIPHEAQQEWRELLRRKCRIVLRLGQDAEDV